MLQGQFGLPGKVFAADLVQRQTAGSAEAHFYGNWSDLEVKNAQIATLTRQKADF